MAEETKLIIETQFSEEGASLRQGDADGAGKGSDRFPKSLADAVEKGILNAGRKAPTPKRAPLTPRMQPMRPLMEGGRSTVPKPPPFNPPQQPPRTTPPKRPRTPTAAGPSPIPPSAAVPAAGGAAMLTGGFLAGFALGVVGLTVAFETLRRTTISAVRTMDQLANFTGKFSAFSPEIIEAQVLTQLAELRQRINLADRAAVGAELISSQAKLNRTMEEIKLLVTEQLTPPIVAIVDLLSGSLEAIKSAAVIFANNFAGIPDLMQAIAQAIEKIPVVGDIFEAVDDMRKLTRMRREREMLEADLKFQEDLADFLNPAQIPGEFRDPRPRDERND